MPRQPSRVQDEVPEDLLASIPVVASDDEGETMTFAIEGEDGASAPASTNAPYVSGALGAALAQQLRYELGEALARELDRAAESFATQVADLERRLAQAESALMSTHEALAAERDARETAEKRLAAFKELALK